MRGLVGTKYGLEIGNRKLTQHRRNTEAEFYLHAVKVDFDDAYELEDLVDPLKVNEPTTCGIA